VIDAATRIFAERGFDASRVDEIARTAEVAEGTVYHLFGTKRGLLEAVGERFGNGLSAAAFANVGPEPAPADIERIVRNIFRYVREADDSLAAFLLLHQPAGGEIAQGANRARMLDAIEMWLRRWVEAGVVPRLDARIAARLQFSAVEAALRECFLVDGGRRPERYVREATRLIAGSLGMSAPNQAARRRVG